MKIAFINISLRPGAKRRILPVGLGYVLTATKKAGFSFDLIDMDVNNLSIEDLRKIFEKNIYDVYAMGCIVSGYKYAKNIAKTIRTINPQATIVAGNSLATSIPEILLKNTEVDIAVLGEGDVTIVELLKNLDLKQNLNNIPGIAFLENDNVKFTTKRNVISNLDKIGFPDWNIFELEKYNKFSMINTNATFEQESLSFPLNSARGCPFNCTFCYHVFKGEKYRKYSNVCITDEISRLHDEFGCNFISFWDELTFPNIASVEQMIKNLQELNFRIGWEAPIRGDLLKHEHLDIVKELKKYGCDNLAFSLENGSQEILKAINKKLNVSQVIEQSHTLWEGGVTPLTSVIFGYPQETPETIQKTIDVCEECNIFPSVGFLLPLPGTEIYQWALDNGKIKNEVEYLEKIGDRQDFHINLTSMEDELFVSTVTEKLTNLSDKLGLKLESVFKTVTYQKPKKQ